MKRWKEDVLRGIVILLLPVLILVKSVVSLFERPLPRTPEEMASLMEKSLAGDDQAWDQLISIPVADPRLEKIRKRLAKLESRMEIERALHGCIEELRTA